jgi:hypothetical protein
VADHRVEIRRGGTRRVRARRGERPLELIRRHRVVAVVDLDPRRRAIAQIEREEREPIEIGTALPGDRGQRRPGGAEPEAVQRLLDERRRARGAAHVRVDVDLELGRAARPEGDGMPQREHAVGVVGEKQVLDRGQPVGGGAVLAGQPRRQRPRRAQVGGVRRWITLRLEQDAELGPITADDERQLERRVIVADVGGV